MTEKIILSIILIFGFFFFRMTGPIIIKSLKEFHHKYNPGLVDKVSWFFKTVEFMYKAMSIMCLILILLVWLEMDPFSLNN